MDAATDSDERVWIRIATDMAEIDVFSERWLVVTDRRLLILHANEAHATNGATTATVQQFPLSEVHSARVEPLVGGGRLEVERSRCARCQRVLPEKDGVCPACLSKLDTLKRLLAYMAPYRVRVALLLAILVAETGLDLLPPLITEHIIDNVLIPAANLNLLLWLVGVLLWDALPLLSPIDYRRCARRIAWSCSTRGESSRWARTKN